MNEYRYVILGPYTREDFHKYFRDREPIGEPIQLIPCIGHAGIMFSVLTKITADKVKPGQPKV